MKYTKREQREMAAKYTPKTIRFEDIKEGFRFYLRADDNGGKMWFEVVDFEYDWQFQEEMPILWNEYLQSFELWPIKQIVSAGYID